MKRGLVSASRDHFNPPIFMLSFRFVTHLVRWSALPLLCLAAVPGQAADPVVYNQPASPANFYTTWDSAQTPTGPVAVGYDNFALADATSVSAVQWYGNYIDTSNPGANPIAPNNASFTVAFFADNGSGYPGAPLSTATIALGDCTPTLLGTDGFSTSSSIPEYQIPFYSYHAVLPTPFVAAAGQKYWISIVANVASSNDNWSWFSSDGGDKRSIQSYQGLQNRDMDRSFALEGAAPSATAPAVSAAATVPKATVGSPVPAVITLSLSAPAASKVNVKYLLGGTAVNGTDYQALGGKAKVKAGATSVEVRVVPQGDLGGASSKTVTLKLQPGNGYAVGTAKAIKVKIVKSNVIVIP